LRSPILPAAVESHGLVRNDLRHHAGAEVRHTDARTGCGNSVLGVAAETGRILRKVQRERINLRAIEDDRGVGIVRLGHDQVQRVAALHELRGDCTPREGVRLRVAARVPALAVVALAPAILACLVHRAVQVGGLHVPDVERVRTVGTHILQRHAVEGDRLHALAAIRDLQASLRLGRDAAAQ
jgi:hypothetical protein